MNELNNDLRKYRSIARFFDTIIILSIAIFFIWQLSPAFQAAVKSAALHVGINLF